MIQPAVFGLTALILAYVLLRLTTKSPLFIIRGPPSPSFIFGHLLELFQRPVGEAEFTWQNLYGNVVRFRGIFGENRLFVADPKALYKILNTSGYTYISPPHYRIMLTLVMGNGIFSAEGDDHKRHRSVMVPGFGQKETNEYFSIFKECADSLSIKWLETIQNGEGQALITDVLAWFLRGTLDAIGQSAFDIKLDSLQDDSHCLAKKYHNFFGDVFGLPSATEVFTQAASLYIPTSILHWIVCYGPNPRLARARDLKHTAMNTAKQVVDEKANALLERNDRDILSRLVKANKDASARNKLSDDELFSEMATILIAGEETTGNSLSWILFELARNPDIQSNLRSEIRQMESTIRARDDPQLMATDLGAMPYLNAVIKEGLRYHAVAPHVQRMANQDDILPLSKPILTSSGKMISEVPVPKGTQIFISVSAFNRDRDIWGEDAHDFNPDRWLNGTIDCKKSAGVGVYSNMMTFLSGTRSCLGWRFAVMELQTFLFELVSKFEFNMTDKSKRIVRQPVLIMAPEVEGEFEQGVQMPLAISLVAQDGAE